MLYRVLFAFALILAPVAAQAKGGAVSSADPRAAEAGREMLRAGGSATDAAMAMMLALTVVEPQSSGIGGGGFLVHHDGRNGQIDTIDGREIAPASAAPGRFLGPEGKPLPYAQAFPGGLSVGVPGNIALMAKAHAKWGRLPWARLFAPAIRLAENGYMVSPQLAQMIAGRAELWRDFPDIRALYWENGVPKPAGAMVHNPDLAATLRRIATGGANAFYTGETQQAISRAVAAAPRNPATITPADFDAYAAKERPALCGRYRVWTVCGMGPPSSGATTILAMLGMLERFDMAALGKDSPVAWHLIGEAMLLGYADRDLYMGDADFVTVPVAGLVDRDYLRQRSALISPDRALGHYTPGTPPGAAPRSAAATYEEHGTTNFAAADRRGEVVTMTSTVEDLFGSQLIAGGMVLNNELTDFSFAPERDGAPAANRVEPGKRPLSSMSPTIVYDAKGRVVLAVGSAGGRRIIMHVLKTLVGTLDWGLSAQDATALPNIFFRDTTLLVEQGSALEEMAPQLSRIGHVVATATLPSKLNAIERGKSGWIGAADPRSEGVALVE